MPCRLLAIAVALSVTLLTACATPSPDSGLALPAKFTALGTEPFWAAKVDGEMLLYQTPQTQTGQNQAGQRVVVTRRAAGALVDFSGSLGGAPLILTIGAGPCTDGMSDTVYSHSAELRIGRQVLTGCTKPK